MTAAPLMLATLLGTSATISLPPGWPAHVSPRYLQDTYGVQKVRTLDGAAARAIATAVLMFEDDPGVPRDQKDLSYYRVQLGERHGQYWVFFSAAATAPEAKGDGLWLSGDGPHTTAVIYVLDQQTYGLEERLGL